MHFKVCLSFRLISGSPWDWQSGNVKHPVFSIYQKQEKQQLEREARLRGGHGFHGRGHPYHSPITMAVHSNVTVFEGDTAQLPCRVANLGEYTVT